MLIFKPDQQLLALLSFDVVDIAHLVTEKGLADAKFRPETTKLISRHGVRDDKTLSIVPGRCHSYVLADYMYLRF